MIPAAGERAAELALLAAVPWPAHAAVASGRFRRTFPTAFRFLTASLAGYLVCCGLLAVLAPANLLRAAAAVAVLTLLALAWCTSEHFGVRRRWPAGALQPLALGPWFDRDFFLERGRRHGGIFKACHLHRPMACVVGLRRGLELLSEHGAALASPALPVGRFIPGGLLRHMPPDRHDATKEYFRGALRREVYAPIEAEIVDRFAAGLDRLAAESAAAGGRGAAPRRHVQRALFDVWARLFLDLEADSPELERLRALFQRIDARDRGGRSDETVRGALRQIEEVLRERLASAGAGAGAGGGPRSFLQAMEQNRPGAIDDASVVGNFIYLMHFTWSDVSGLLVWIVRQLTSHPEWRERLRVPQLAGARTAGGGLPLPVRVVLETLRLEQIEHLYRVATRTIEHDGVVIPRGWLVRVCVRESHRDPEIFRDPERFDPDRFLERTYSRSEFAPFGLGGPHACLGEDLTRFVGALFATTLARGYDWRTVADGELEYSAWRHWRPSSAWRIEAWPRGGAA